MSFSKNNYRIICTKENEEEISQFIKELGFSIQSRYDRGIIILELKLPHNYNPYSFKQLIDLQDYLLHLS